MVLLADEPGRRVTQGGGTRNLAGIGHAFAASVWELLIGERGAGGELMVENRFVGIDVENAHPFC